MNIAHKEHTGFLMIIRCMNLNWFAFLDYVRAQLSEVKAKIKYLIRPHQFNYKIVLNGKRSTNAVQYQWYEV